MEITHVRANLRPHPSLLTRIASALVCRFIASVSGLEG